MPKKKKTSRKRKAEKVAKERSPIWSMTWAVVVILVALILILGGFGTGGVVPVKLFHFLYVLFGYAAYVLPLSMIYLGIHMFKSEKHEVPINKVSGIVAIELFLGGFFYCAFANKNLTGVWSGGHGGVVGKGIGSLAFLAFDKIPASLIFFV